MLAGIQVRPQKIEEVKKVIRKGLKVSLDAKVMAFHAQKMFLYSKILVQSLRQLCLVARYQIVMSCALMCVLRHIYALVSETNCKNDLVYGHGHGHGHGHEVFIPATHPEGTMPATCFRPVTDGYELYELGLQMRMP